MKENMLDLYSDFLIAQNKYATATGFADLYDGEISHDKVTRFLKQIQSRISRFMGIH